MSQQTIDPQLPRFMPLGSVYPSGLSPTTAPNIQQRLRAVSIRGWNLEVRLYFATQHPDKKLLAEAQAQLDRLLPPSR